MKKGWCESLVFLAGFALIVLGIIYGSIYLSQKATSIEEPNQNDIWNPDLQVETEVALYWACMDGCRYMGNMTLCYDDYSEEYYQTCSTRCCYEYIRTLTCVSLYINPEFLECAEKIGAGK